MLPNNGVGAFGGSTKYVIVNFPRDLALVGPAGTPSRAGGRLVSAMGEGNGDSPADAFMRTVIDGAPQYEHGLIRARTRAVLAAKRARGERVGAVPYGFAMKADGVRLVAAGREQAAIARARAHPPQ